MNMPNNSGDNNVNVNTGGNVGDQTTPMDAPSQSTPGSEPLGDPTSAAASSSPSPAADPQTVSGDPNAGGTPAADNNPPPAEDKYVITKMPPRGTAEYDQAFNELSFEDQMKIEEEINSIYNETDPDLLALMNQDGKKPDEDPAADPDNKDGDNQDPQNKDGDNQDPKPDAGGTGSEEFQTITKDVFEKLPPEVQGTVKAMNSKIEELESWATPEFKKGFEAVNSDPVIQNRLEELAAGKNEVSNHVKTAYDPNEHVDVERVNKLGIKSDEAKAELSNMLFEAAQKGHKIASDNANLKFSDYQNQVKVKVEVDKQLDKMVSDNPSMKSDLAYDHNDHPLKEFFDWVGEKGIAPKQFAELGVKNVFTMYQSQTGNLDKIIENQVTATKKKLFLDLEAMDNTARNMSRTSQTDTVRSQGQMYNGIDLKRYNADSGYRSKMYDQADWETQQGLEMWITQGKVPQKK